MKITFFFGRVTFLGSLEQWDWAREESCEAARFNLKQQQKSIFLKLLVVDKAIKC